MKESIKLRWFKDQNCELYDVSKWRRRCNTKPFRSVHKSMALSVKSQNYRLLDWGSHFCSPKA